jgi:CYTH domain-containing protein
MTALPTEIERKYIIRIPDTETMRKYEGYTESEILQIYLKTESSGTHRIRRRLTDGKAVYTETKKIRIDSMSCIEDEREISEYEFSSLSNGALKGTAPVRKVRHTFEYKGHTFEVDIYPEWKRTCILEIELSTRTESVEFPDFIKMIEEVTGNRAYSNASMSRAFPKESEC